MRCIPENKSEYICKKYSIKVLEEKTSTRSTNIFWQKSNIEFDLNSVDTELSDL